jgi:hypothetical protein
LEKLEIDMMIANINVVLVKVYVDFELVLHHCALVFEGGLVIFLLGIILSNADTVEVSFAFLHNCRHIDWGCPHNFLFFVVHSDGE